jgi:hypothetical protein
MLAPAIRGPAAAGFQGYCSMRRRGPPIRSRGRRPTKVACPSALCYNEDRWKASHLVAQVEEASDDVQPFPESIGSREPLIGEGVLLAQAEGQGILLRLLTMVLLEGSRG